MFSRTSVLALLAGLALPLTAQAQSKFFRPTFQALSIYDDNFFSTSSSSDRVATYYFRFVPAFHAGYNGTSVSFRAGYAVEAEVFPELGTGLSDPLARQRASVGFSYFMNPRTSLTLDAAYTKTDRPSELVEPTGLDLGRLRSESYGAGLTFKRQLSAHNDWDVGYNYRLLEFDSANPSISHSLTTAWSHRYSNFSMTTLRYTFRFYSFGDELTGLFLDGRTARSHLLTFGWTRQVSSGTSITLQLGPRLSEDFVGITTPSENAALSLENALGADAIASINYNKEKNRLSLAYSRHENQVFARSGFVDTDSLVFVYGYGDRRSFGFSVSPGAFRNTRGGAETWTYRASVNVGVGLAEWLKLTGSYRYSLQQGRFVSTPAGIFTDGREFDHNVVKVGLTFGHSFPLE